MNMLVDDSIWIPLFSTDADGVQHDEAIFNHIFREAGSGIIRRQCSGCASTHQDVYIKIYNPAQWNTYTELLITWSNSGSGSYFNIYSSLADAQAGRNARQACRGKFQNIVFPRNCGPTGTIEGQWNSFKVMGQLHYSYSVLQAPPTPTPAPAPGDGNQKWEVLVSVGSYGNQPKMNRDAFNAAFRKAGTGILRRECLNCQGNFEDVYIKVYAPAQWDAYNELLVTWTARGWGSKFNVYSSLQDAYAGRKPWRRTCKNTARQSDSHGQEDAGKHEWCERRSRELLQSHGHPVPLRWRGHLQHARAAGLQAVPGVPGDPQGGGPRQDEAQHDHHGRAAL